MHRGICTDTILFFRATLPCHLAAQDDDAYREAHDKGDEPAHREADVDGLDRFVKREYNEIPEHTQDAHTEKREHEGRDRAAHSAKSSVTGIHKPAKKIHRGDYCGALCRDLEGYCRDTAGLSGYYAVEREQRLVEEQDHARDKSTDEGGQEHTREQAAQDSPIIFRAVVLPGEGHDALIHRIRGRIDEGVEVVLRRVSVENGGIFRVGGQYGIHLAERGGRDHIREGDKRSLHR